jgi:hypothetical protein
MSGYHYVTYFDENFLPQAGVLLDSLNANHPDAHIHCLCLTDDAFYLLPYRNSVSKYRPGDWIDMRHSLLKKSRSRKEFIWSLTPFSLLFVLERIGEGGIAIYVDADCQMLASPVPLLANFQFQKASIFLTPHAYDLKCDQSDLSGKYCVQFMPVKQCGRSFLAAWDDLVFYDCPEDARNGKFGDQKYLDRLALSFRESITEPTNPLIFGGPWNGAAVRLADCLLWHFHDVKKDLSGQFQHSDWYQLKKEVIDSLYEPYLLEVNSN